MSRPVVVSGIGLVSAFGATPESFREALLSGQSAVSPITAFDVAACRTRRAASIHGFDAAAWIAPMKLRRMDDTSRYAVIIARQALEDSGYPLDANGDDAVGVVLGHFYRGRRADERLPSRAASGRSRRCAGAALQQHGRKRTGEPRRTRVQTPRAERHGESKGSVEPRRDCHGHRHAAKRPCQRTRRGRRRRHLRDLLSCARRSFA